MEVLLLLSRNKDNAYKNSSLHLQVYTVTRFMLLNQIVKFIKKMLWKAKESQIEFTQGSRNQILWFMSFGKKQKISIIIIIIIVIVGVWNRSYNNNRKKICKSSNNRKWKVNKNQVWNHFRLIILMRIKKINHNKKKLNYNNKK